LTFVDAVFADPEAREGLTLQGAGIKHHPLRTEAKGRVEFWPSLKPSAAPEPDPWRPVDTESQSSPVVRLAVRIAEQIRQWTDGRTKLPGHDRPISPGDIMILLPRREPFGSEIIRRLKERGVAVAGADRIRLSEQIAVMDLIALGRFVLLPQDDLNLAALLRSPLVEISEEELFALSHGRTGHLWSELTWRKDELASFTRVFAFLSDMRARADYAPPFEFYAHALGTRGLRLKLLARLGSEANDAIDEFLSLAFAYEAANTPSLEGFLHWVERGGAEIKRDMERGRDEVRVMTVHGAKGLEADIVILPDTTTLPEQPGVKGHLLYTEDGALFPLAEAAAPPKVKAAKAAAEAETLKEHRRLLYVALTRAKDRLYICGFEGKNGVKPGSWYALAERAAETAGIKVVRGDETIHVLGDAADEIAEPLLPLDAPPPTLPAWTREAAPIEKIAPRLIRPSDASDVEEPAMDSPLGPKGAARFRRGLLVHALLARLPEMAPAARRNIALKFLHGRVDAETADAIAGETLRVLSDPVFAAAFAPGSRAEAAVVADLPELGEGARVNGRIDRLAVTDSEVLVVDFKTNRPPPARAEDVPQIYLAQMALYRAAVARIFPDRRIACALVWTEGPALMPLPAALLDGEIRRIAARLGGRIDVEGGRS
jgi:ATP-dependent helicase/nuclease subunit A